MSLFDYPRINVQGTVQLSPGTANNDDYAGVRSLPQDWGPFAGQTLALIDSKTVRARTYGMSDEAFVKWVQKERTFDITAKKGKTAKIIPAEWNYYGAMDSKNLSVHVLGVQTSPEKIYSQPRQDVPLSQFIGSELTFSGHFTDVNSEGSPPATQFFIDKLTVGSGTPPLISGAANKATAQWLNFYRNVNLVADGGAGAYVYHILPGAKINSPDFKGLKMAGLIFRYYLYRPFLGGTASGKTNKQIAALYKQEKTNPAILELAGTFAPLFKDERIVSAPSGRLMVFNTRNIPTPKGSNNNGVKGLIALAPAVLQQTGGIVSADFSGTFPDYYRKGANPKYDFGPVSLLVCEGKKSATVGKVEYANTEAGNQKGWMFDFDISKNRKAQKILKNPDAYFKLAHPKIGDVLQEAEFYFVTNQQAIYTEQFGSGSFFVNQGFQEPATVSVFRRGRRLDAKNCPPITVWQYRSVPLQSPGDAEAIHSNFKPGQTLQVETEEPGNFLFTFTINTDSNPPPAGYPPKSYSVFMDPPFITNAPSISLRILPNDEDFSIYYEDPGAEEPVGNALLTFQVVYEKVMRTYYLLYPAMNKIFRLNDERAVAQNAQAILDVTEPSIWMSSGYMPRTRDLSSSRRTLLRAWCRRVLAEQSA